MSKDYASKYERPTCEESAGDYLIERGNQNSNDLAIYNLYAFDECPSPS